MVSLINQLTALFQSAMRQAYPALPAEITASVTPITKEQFGDYQFNSGTLYFSIMTHESFVSLFNSDFNGSTFKIHFALTDF